MKRVFHHIRKQPEEIRRHILHVFIVACAAILISLWVYSLGANIANSNTQAKISQDMKPFSVLKDDIVNGPSSNSQSNTDSNSDLTNQVNSL